MPNRHALLTILLLALAGLYATWSDAAMIWDGACQLALTLYEAKPYFYLSRFHSWILWQPVHWLDYVTGNLAILKAAYGAPFCLAGAFSAAVCWWITRRQAPHLFLWAVFGIAIGTLPGQIFIINDSIFQMHLLWPVFLGAFLPLTRRQTVAIVLLSIFQLSHPIGIGACAFIAAGALVLAWKEPHRRGPLLAWAVWHGLLSASGVVKLLLWPDPYAAAEATFAQAWNTLFSGVLSYPLPGLLAMWSAAFLLLWKMRRASSEDAGRHARTIAWLLLGTALFWLYWSSDVHRWYPAINYRRWVFPVSFPFLAAAYFEIWCGEGTRLPLIRGRVAVSLAAIFLLVFGAQCATWHTIWHRLETQVAENQEPTLNRDAVPWVGETALGHWGIYSQVLIIQGKRPHTLFVEKPELDAALANPPQVAFSPFTLMIPNTNAHGWFDWDPVLERIRSSKAVDSATRSDE